MPKISLSSHEKDSERLQKKQLWVMLSSAFLAFIVSTSDVIAMDTPKTLPTENNQEINAIIHKLTVDDWVLIFNQITAKDMYSIMKTSKKLQGIICQYMTRLPGLKKLWSSREHISPEKRMGIICQSPNSGWERAVRHTMQHMPLEKWHRNDRAKLNLFAYLGGVGKEVKYMENFVDLYNSIKTQGGHTHSIVSEYEEIYFKFSQELHLINNPHADKHLMFENGTTSSESSPYITPFVQFPNMSGEGKR